MSESEETPHRTGTEETEEMNLAKKTLDLLQHILWHAMIHLNISDAAIARIHVHACTCTCTDVHAL